MATITETRSAQATVAVLELHLRPAKKVLEEMAESELFTEEEKKVIAAGLKRVDADETIALGGVLLYAVRPAMERYGEDIQESLFEWAEGLENRLGDKLSEIEAMDCAKRMLAARVDGIRAGYLDGRQILKAEAMAMNDRMVQGMDKVVEEAKAFEETRKTNIEKTTARIRELHREHMEVSLEFEAMGKRAEEAGERLSALDKRTQPILSHAEGVIKGMRS